MLCITLPHRGEDDYGSGEFHASRGHRAHMGIDYAAPAGGIFLSPVVGTVTHLGYPYADDLSYRYVQVTDNYGMAHRFFYVNPIVEIGDVVGMDCVLGQVQNLCTRYPADEDHPNGMVNHVHYEVKNKEGEHINPEGATHG